MSSLTATPRGASVVSGLLAGVFGIVGLAYVGPLPVTPALLMLLLGVGGTPVGASLYGWRRLRAGLALLCGSATLLFGGTLMGMASIGVYSAPAALLAMLSTIVAVVAVFGQAL